MPKFDPIIINQAAKKAMEKLGQDGKPVGDYSYDIQWDGKREGKDTINFGAGGKYYKVSSKVLTADELVGATFTSLYVDGTGVLKAENLVDGSMFGIATPFIGIMGNSNIPLAISCKTFTIDNNGTAVSAPTDGTYFLEMDGMDVVSSLSKETIVPIDQKYLGGVCLPVVELSTELANGTALTDAESATLSTAFEGGAPVVIRCTACFSILEGMPVSGQFVFCPQLLPLEGQSTKAFCGVIYGINVMFIEVGANWVCAIEESA